MECLSITREAMGPFQISDTPFQGNVTLNIDFWRRLWTRFGPKRVCAPQKVFFLISMEWSAEKGIRRSGSQVPVNTSVSLAACTSLPCMFSLTLHLNLRHFDCLSADFISPLLLFSEASLLTLTNYCRCWRVFPVIPPCELALFWLPLCWLSVVSWSCFLAKYYGINWCQICSRHPGAHQSVTHSGFLVAS